MSGYADLIAKKLQEAKDRDENPSVKRRSLTTLPTIPQNATCGRCAYQTYNGIHEVKLEYGVCNMWPQCNSGADRDRLVNRFDSPACPYWRQRSPAKMSAENRYAHDMQEVIASMNRGLKGGSRSSDAVKIPKVARPREIDQVEMPDGTVQPKKKGKGDAASALAALGFSLGAKKKEAEIVEDVLKEIGFEVVGQDEEDEE